jgi:hypothetical protein
MQSELLKDLIKIWLSREMGNDVEQNLNITGFQQELLILFNKKKFKDAFDSIATNFIIHNSSNEKNWINILCSDVELGEIAGFMELIQFLRYQKESTQKGNGSYYTPNGIVCFILELLGPAISSAKNAIFNRNRQSKQLRTDPESYSTFRFCDHACGMGIFLFYTAAYVALYRNHVQIHYQNTKYPPCRYIGLDQDSFSIRWAKFLQKVIQKHPVYGTEIANCEFHYADSLSPIPPQIIKQITPVKPNEYQENMINIIITNPPYISWGLGRVGKLEKTQDLEYRKRFPNVAEYKLSLYSLFMERAMQLLELGGKAVFLIPDSFLMGTYFTKLRYYLLTHARIRYLVLFEKNFWKAADSGKPVILYYEKPDPVADQHIATLEGKPWSEPKIEVMKAELSDKIVHITSQNLIDPAYFLHQPQYRFRIITDPKLFSMIYQIEQNSTPLSQWFELHHGIRSKTGVGKVNIVATKQLSPAWKHGLTTGNSITPYHIEYQGHFIHVNPDILFSGGFDPNHIEQPKIILRRTGDRLIAAVDPDGFYHTNTLIYLIPKPNSHPPLTLYALAGILNSDFMNQYYQAISMKEKRTMPQVEINMVEQLPLKIHPLLMQELDSAVKTLHELRDQWPPHSLNAKIRKTIDELGAVIEETVQFIYLNRV